MIGFSLKFWSMTPGPGDDGFLIENISNYIFQDETHEHLAMLAEVVRKIVGTNPDLDKCLTTMMATLGPGPVTHTEPGPGVNPGDFVNVKHEVKTCEPLVKLEPETNDDGDHESKETRWMDDDFTMIDNKKKNEKKSVPSGPIYKCEVCLKGFSWVKNFATHLNECNPPQLEEEFASLKPAVQRKIRKFLSMTPEERKSIKNEKTDKAKMKYPKGPFFCEKCPQVFQKYPGFVSHVNAHNLSAKNNSKSDPDSGAPVEPKVQLEYQLDDLRDGLVMRCDKCDLAYSAFQSYKNHMDQYHKKGITCEHCGMKFTLRNTLVKHKVDYHTLYPRKCDQCTSTLMTAKEFFEHLQQHGKNFLGKTAPCEICGKMLKNKYVLKAHVEAVHEKKTKSGQFSCDECGKILGTKASLEYHRKSAHLQEYPYRCEVCGKGFLKYNRMMTCLNNHHGIYKYRCTECDYKTNKLLQYKEHMNSHTRAIIYYCPVCNQQSNGTKNLGCHTKQVIDILLISNKYFSHC